MSQISKIVSYYEQALDVLDLGLGEIFPYTRTQDGLKMLGEMIARLKRLEIASFVKSPTGTNGFLTLPSGYFTEGFQMDDKLIVLLEPDLYLTLIQAEKNLNKGIYLIVGINTDGSKISIYTIHKCSGDIDAVAHLDPGVNEISHKEAFICLMKLLTVEVNKFN